MIQLQNETHRQAQIRNSLNGCWPGPKGECLFLLNWSMRSRTYAGISEMVSHPLGDLYIAGETEGVKGHGASWGQSQPGLASRAPDRLFSRLYHTLSWKPSAPCLKKVKPPSPRCFSFPERTQGGQMALEDTERTDRCFGAGRSGPTLFHVSNTPQSLHPTNSTPTMHLPVILSCRKRHKALT